MIGFVPLARTTFDMPFAEANIAAALRQARLHLGGAGFEVREIVAPVTGPEGVQEAINVLRGQPLDLLIVLQATFADTSMVMTLTDPVHGIDAPILLWALPEPTVGGRLRLNSLCGINLAAFALKSAARRYTYLYASPDDDAAMTKLVTVAKAGRAAAALNGARVGVVGQHPTGFEPCAYDAPWLRDHLGVTVQTYDLNAMFIQADAVSNDRVEARYDVVAARLPNLGDLNGKQVRGTLSFYEAMRETVSADALKGVAVRCWPETFLQRDCAVCASSSMLSDDGIPASCEADVNGTVTQILLQSLSGEAAFGADLVSADMAQNTVVFWHCGLAPLSMCDPEFQPRGTLHTNRQRPLLMEFPLKPGRVTVSRLTRAGANGGYRLVIGAGEMLRAPMQFTGTSGVFRFDSPLSAVMDTIMREGLDHHYSITYGDHTEALLLFASLTGLEVVRL